jgi:cytochrome P450
VIFGEEAIQMTEERHKALFRAFSELSYNSTTPLAVLFPSLENWIRGEYHERQFKLIDHFVYLHIIQMKRKLRLEVNFNRKASRTLLEDIVATNKETTDPMTDKEIRVSTLCVM